MTTANKRETVRAVCSGTAKCSSQRYQNKSPALNTLAKLKYVSANADIWKISNIGRYIGDISVDH